MRYILFLTLAMASCLNAQTVPAAEEYRLHGLLLHQEGELLLKINSPRPVEQAMSLLRREYGLILDYEEGPPKPGDWVESSERPSGAWKAWKPYAVKVPEPQSKDLSSATQCVSNTLTQLSAQGSIKFELIRGIKNRITVAPSAASERILDTVVVVPPAKRTIYETIDAILAGITNKTGTPVVIGGIADTELLSRSVIVGDTSPQPARALLAAALDGASMGRYWILSWEPSDKTFYIGIQSAVKVEKGPNGEVRILPVY